MTKKNAVSNYSRRLNNLNKSVEFEKRYGTERTLGIAIQKEQEIREKLQIAKINKNRYKQEKKHE